ncbi:MAG: Ig-like domain-containing protein [Clostridia bacterium]|nr:Ig-like domain-containing protein [Clostridia bacterium]
MNHNRIIKRLALLLTLALLLAGTALAEIEIAGEGLPNNELDLALENVDLELPEGGIDIDLSTALDGLDAVDDVPAIDISGTPNAETTTLMLGVNEKHALDVQAIGGGKKVKFKSSKATVAKVTSKGVIKGVKKGRAKITCTVGGKTAAVYTVRVLPAPGKVTLSAETLTLGVKQSATLAPSIPAGTHASFTWSSKDATIAAVSQAGKITGKKAGTTTVTVKTHNGRKASVKVTVKKAPRKVTLDRRTASLNVKDTLRLKATLPSGTYSPITWSSSDKKIARVSAAGKVTAVAVGTATITAATYNGRTAACVVTVNPDEAEVDYRALLIGEENFLSDVCTRNRGDVLHMENMLMNVKGYYGGRYSITKKYDLSAKQVLSAIKTTFADADENDVSLFFIATHGDVSSTGEYAGYLSMVPSGDMLLGELANALKAVPGKVIVILESCGSGAAVYANGNGATDRKAMLEAAKQRAKAFDAAAIRAFANADTGVRVRVDASDSGDTRANTGEFRVDNKFYVLTASDYNELSWGNEVYDADRSYNYFTLWLIQGIGVSGSMPADANNNGQTTLNELYQYISDVGDDYPFRPTDGGVYYQHVQVYPAKSNFVLFCR